MFESEWLVNGCLSEEEGNAPELGLSIDQKQALLAFKNIDGYKNLSVVRRFVPHEYATRTMKRLQCASCHSGQNKLPEISLAGEKFHTGWIASLLQGEVQKTRPWLSARMPEFHSRSKFLAQGIAARAGMPLEKEELKIEEDKVRIGKEIA